MVVYVQLVLIEFPYLYQTIRLRPGKPYLGHTKELIEGITMEQFVE
jgi:hypothetical protein